MLLQSKRFQKIAQAGQKIESLGQQSELQTIHIGSLAISKTVLRPSGKIDLNGENLDAFTEGEYIEPNENVIITAYFNGSYKVKRA
ncbi:MAG: hypothetical protein EAZ53_03150 [Bacteroidetes bacterium]|nr:MAG: hypothetical protein EAZ53_03150 [Bacteroidota bacterium]